MARELSILLSLLAMSAGCGYQLAGQRGVMPGGAASVRVGVFENHSREVGLDEQLVFALEREIYRRGIVRVVEGDEIGETELRGAIRRFRTRPVAFDSADEALQYEIELTVDAVLERREDGEVLWRGSGIHAADAYSVSTDTVVPTSSRFQRGRINFEALDDLTPIQLAETERRQALQRLVESVVRDLHDRMLDDF